MKKGLVFVLAVMACLLFAGVGLAGEGPVSDVEISFMGIKFGTPFEEVDAIFKKNGLDFLEKDSDEYYLYRGKVGNDDATVLLSMLDNKIEGVIISFMNKSFPQWNFESKTDILSKKYGKAYSRYRVYEYPYKEGDEDFETGIGVEKIRIMDLYKDKNDNAILIRIDKKKTVEMIYESKKHIDEIERRREKANEVF